MTPPPTTSEQLMPNNDSSHSSQKPPLHLGVDIGSTTLKFVIFETKLDSEGAILFEHYDRHKFDVHGAIELAFTAATPILRDRMITATGSAGMQLAETMELPHVQEVVACATAVTELLEDVDVAVELGGEDTKIIYFSEDGNGLVHEARMNSTCAAGTGSFLDQMAALLGTDTLGLAQLADNASDTRYPIASRCGVFAKSDIQPLLAEGVAKEDIAASVLQAVVTQTVGGLACGRPIKPYKKGRKVAFLGGPLHFLDGLRSQFVETLDLGHDEFVSPSFAHQMVCRGAAIHGSKSQQPMPFTFVERRFHMLRDYALPVITPDSQTIDVLTNSTESERLDPLFTSGEEMERFRERHSQAKIERAESSDLSMFLGIDSGSTTTKLVVIDSESRLIFSCYDLHRGNTLQGAINAIISLYDADIPMDQIKQCFVTGYGEGLLTTALHADGGIVETIAHLTAARHFKPDTDFVLDIGGQDMKAMRVDSTTGVISEVYLNEACSSGCGTFIQTLADSLGLGLSEFAERGLAGKSPLDLGTRCTVFMGSRIKQAQKDGATVEDISAGLAMSVVKNCLFKVMRLRSADEAGKHIVVQGGTFLSDSVLRALEITLDREVIRPDCSGHMGALGAALIAQKKWNGDKDATSNMLGVEDLRELAWDTSTRRCGKCTNNCQLTVHEFSNGDTAVLGNRCERGAGATERKNASIPDLWTWQKNKTFSCKSLALSKAKRGKIGIPRVLEMYDDYPFWHTVLTELGFRVVLSGESSEDMFSDGMDSIPDDGVCTPVKLVHGHFAALAKAKVPVIFYPGVVVNQSEPAETNKHYNCPLMSAYPDIIRANMKFEDADILVPQLPLNEPTKIGRELLKSLVSIDSGMSLAEVNNAVTAGYAALEKHRLEIREKGDKVLKFMDEKKVPGIVLAGRPYHADPLLSSAIPHMLTAAGYCVLTIESVCHHGVDMTAPLIGLNLFVYDGRSIAAAKFVASRRDIGMIQLISFGCSISPNTDDEAKSIIRSANGAYCVIKIDQNTSVGAVRVRVRSLIAAMEERRNAEVACPSRSLPTYDGPMVFNRLVKNCPKAPHKLAIFPFSPTHVKLWVTAFNSAGYNVVVPDATSRDINEAGLKYCNPDQCYGVTLTAGRFIYGFTSGQLDPKNTDVLWLHTGGVCTAASMAWAIKTSLANAGYPDIVVHTIDFSGAENPGVGLMQNLRINMSMTMSDVLEKCVLRTRPYEVVKGSADTLYNKCLEEAVPYIDHGNIFKYKSKIRDIVQAFESLPLVTEEQTRPRVGFVGLMTRHCPEMWDWVINYIEKEQHCEVVMHDMGDFAVAPAINNQVAYRIGYDTNTGRYFGTYAHKFFVNLFRDPAMHVLQKSKRFTAWLSITELFNLTEQYFTKGSVPSGESWLPLAEAIHMIMTGTKSVVFNVPFQCLPSHAGNRGIFRRLREHHPDANIVCLDYDSTTSTLNQFNRVKLLLECMEERRSTGSTLQSVTCNLNDIEELGSAQCVSCSISDSCAAVEKKNVVVGSTPIVWR